MRRYRLLKKDTALLEQILDDSNQMIQVSDVETFSMMYANKSARMYTGHADETYEGKHCYEYMMGRTEKCPFCPMLQLGEREYFESEIDNGEQVFAVKTKIIEYNGVKSFVEYAWDITQIRRSQQIYKSQIQTLIKTVSDAQGIFHLDITDDSVISIEGNSKEIHKMSDKVSVDRMLHMIAEYVPDEDARKEFQDIFNRKSLIEAYNGGRVEVLHETDSYFDDGSVRPARVTARLIMNPGNNHLECIIYGMDISYEKMKENDQQEALRNALAAAEHANKAKTVFLNNMSHDIRTPMNAIIGFTALAAAHIDNTELVKDYLKKITTSGTHLLSLINDVLDMSRIESGSVKIDEKEVHLPDVLHDLRSIIQGNIAAKQQDLYIDTQDVRNEDIITDKLRLNQILLNIVSNAIKFTPVGGMISIRVSEYPCDIKGFTTYEFRIRDNGIGMSEEFCEHVFDSFSRERSSTTSGIQGTGLGMAITKNIVDMMGGTITVRSKEGEGSEFTVTLNCMVSEKAIKNEPIAELQGSRALVADDDTNTCMSVGKMLRDIGMRADWTTSGREAVIRAKEAHEQKDEFKAYIIDWLMPDMNGIETVRRIRKVIGDMIPIIILTAYDWADIEEEAREAGVTAFVSKPLFMSELRAVLTMQARAGEPPVDVSNSVATTDHAGKRVLLVEDNELNQEIAAAILKEAGLIVDIVGDGVEAVDRMSAVSEDEYDLILMDIQMPKMDGYTATREIRTLNNSRKANIPIIAMTANAFEEDRQKAFKAGMDAHISKPIDIPALFKTLDKILK